MSQDLLRIVRIAAFLVIALIFNALAKADTAKVEGLIKGRSGDTMIVQTADNPNLLVLFPKAYGATRADGLRSDDRWFCTGRRACACRVRPHRCQDIHRQPGWHRLRQRFGPCNTGRV